MKHYTTAETARELNTTIRTVSRWLKTGVITGTKPGDTWQITAAEVERMRAVRATGQARRLPAKALCPKNTIIGHKITDNKRQ